MRHVIALTGTAIILAACADAPAPTVMHGPTTVAPVAASPASAGNKITPDLLKMAASVGYFPRTRAGVAVFCRTDSDVGTRFTTEKCINEDQLAEVVQRSREVHDNMRKGGVCSTPNCGN